MTSLSIHILSSQSADLDSIMYLWDILQEFKNLNYLYVNFSGQLKISSETIERVLDDLKSIDRIWDGLCWTYGQGRIAKLRMVRAMQEQKNSETLPRLQKLEK